MWEQKNEPLPRVTSLMWLLWHTQLSSPEVFCFSLIPKGQCFLLDKGDRRRRCVAKQLRAHLVFRVPGLGKSSHKVAPNVTSFLWIKGNTTVHGADRQEEKMFPYLFFINFHGNIICMKLHHLFLFIVYVPARVKLVAQHPGSTN